LPAHPNGPEDGLSGAGRVPPGSTIGGFVVADVLGEGGFGTVYRAHGLGATVAIKVFKRDAASLQTRLAASEQNEIEALLKLKHPSLVQLRSYGYLPQGGLWLVMELVEGEPLNQYLHRRGKLDAIEAIRIVRKLAEALAYCHDRNIAHLDLKPQNIILVDPEEPLVKVLDFGLARFEGGWNPSDFNVRVGTVPYMAPELLSGGRTHLNNARIDLHALGIIFYELLAGRLPFDHSDHSELIERKRAGTILPLRNVTPDVPEAVEQVVLQLLATDPAMRPGSAAWLVSCLQDLYFATLGGGEPVAVSAPPSIVTPERVPLVGRRSELERLRSAFAAVGRGAGSAIVVVGEAGLGKSRLVSEFLDDPSVSAHAVIAYGRCRELKALAGYSTLREALGQLVRRIIEGSSRVDDQLRRAITAGLGEHAELLCGLIPEFRRFIPEPAAGDEDVVRAMAAPHVGRAIRRLLTEVGRSGRLILVLEDLDRADEGTLRVITHLTHGEIPAGVLLLWTTRSDAWIPADATLERIVLSPFDATANREHLSHLLPGSTSTILTRLQQSIPVLSAGNPLFNTQVLRNLETEGYLARTGTGTLVLSAEAASGYKPPESVSMALQRTLARLDADVLRVLSSAALFGDQFTVSAVAGLGLFSLERVQQALDEAERHFLCRAIGDTYVFVHESIRGHLKAATEPEQVPKLHGLIARQLQRSGGSPAALAYHLERAGELGEASRSYFQAGLEHDASHDPIGSCRHLERALDLLAQMQPSTARDALLVRTAHELARIGCLAGDTAQTLTRLQQCDALLQESEEHAIVIMAAYARVFYAQGDFQSAVMCSRHCLGLIARHPEFASHACVPTNILGRVLIASGRPREAVAMLTKGCDLARSVGEHVELAHSEGVLSVALANLGEYERAEECAASCAAFATRLRDPLRTAASYFYQSVFAEMKFDWAMGVKYTTRLLSYAQEHGIGGLYLLMATMFAGRHQYHLGRLKRAEVLLLNALNLSRAVGISMGVGWAHAFLGDVRFVSNRLTLARESYARGLEIGNAGGRDEYAAGMSLIGLAQCAGQAGQASEARLLVDEGLRRLEDAGLLAVLAHALQRCAEIMETIGDGDAAKRFRALEKARFDALGITPCAWRPEVFEEASTATVDAPGSTPGERQSLLETLSTIDGVIPGFASSRRV
jgi:tetratricopeptide (TPR) repeat protein